MKLYRVLLTISIIFFNHSVTTAELTYNEKHLFENYAYKSATNVRQAIKNITTIASILGILKNSSQVILCAFKKNAIAQPCARTLGYLAIFANIIYKPSHFMDDIEFNEHCREMSLAKNLAISTGFFTLMLLFFIKKAPLSEMLNVLYKKHAKHFRNKTISKYLHIIQLAESSWPCKWYLMSECLSKAITYGVKPFLSCYDKCFSDYFLWKENLRNITIKKLKDKYNFSPQTTYNLNNARKLQYHNDVSFIFSK